MVVDDKILEEIHTKICPIQTLQNMQLGFCFNQFWIGEKMPFKPNDLQIHQTTTLKLPLKNYVSDKHKIIYLFKRFLQYAQGRMNPWRHKSWYTILNFTLKLSQLFIQVHFLTAKIHNSKSHDTEKKYAVLHCLA